MKTAEFNPFEYAETQEEISEVLLECYNDSDPNTLVTALV